MDGARSPLASASSGRGLKPRPCEGFRYPRAWCAGAESRSDSVVALMMQSGTRFRPYLGYGNLYPAPGRNRSKHCPSLASPVSGLRQSAAGYCRPPGAIFRLRRLGKRCGPDTLLRLRPFVFPALLVQGLPPLPILRPEKDFAVRRVPGRGSASRPSAPAVCLYNPEDP